MEAILWVAFAAAVAVLLIYAAVLPFGAPYLPTLRKQSSEALDLLALKPGQVFVDLGCGDGRLLSLAAERGLKAVGYELNPFLVLYAWLRTRRYGRQVKVRLGNFWQADLSDADGVFVFLIGHYMAKLDKMIVRYSKGRQIKLVSHAFKIPGKKAASQKGVLMLYVYNGTKSKAP